MIRIFCVAVLLAALPGSQAHAQASQPPQPPGASKPPAYTPPQRGAPARRVGGSSRGVTALPAVLVLAPDHVGLTASENPSLYWYLSRPTSVRVEITLIDDKGETPLIEYALENAQGPAVHRLDLAKHDIRLKPGVEYQWSISVVPNPKERSNDVMAGAAVKRVEAPAAVGALRARGVGADELARAYASEGLWYDAIAAYSELIEKSPRDRALREQRAALLEQVGLRDIAAFDRRAAD